MFSNPPTRLSYADSIAPFQKDLPTHAALDALVDGFPKSVMSSHGQLSYDDRLLYYWVAKNFYAGRGTIIDAGALVGATTVALSEGVKANSKAANAPRPIHVYDLFTDDSNGHSARVIKQWFNDQANAAEPYDFETHFRTCTADHAELITVHKGDISKQSYDDPRDIEILSIDVAKTPALMHSVARTFFPRLMQPRSIILHQDYIFSRQPWLIVAMELMSDLMTLVYEVPSQVTAVFAPVRPITEDDVIARLGSDPRAYYCLENAHTFYSAIERATTPVARLYYTAALAHFYTEKGKVEAARNVAKRMIDDFSLTAAFVKRTELNHLFADILKIDYKALCH